MKIRERIDLNLSIRIHLFFCCALFVWLFFFISSLKNEIDNFKKQKSVYKRFSEKYKKEGEGAQSLLKITLPYNLKNLSLRDNHDLILKTKKITIRNVTAPHNGSIIKRGDGYLIFFRYDIKHKHDYSSYIGCAELDANFDQTAKEFVKIDTFDNHSEDPRIFTQGKEVYLVYTKSEFKKEIYPPFTSTINIASIDLENYKLKFITNLDPHFNSIEKNWVPFDYKDRIYFQYSLNPHKILLLPDPQENHLICTNEETQNLSWGHPTSGWGTLRGGTPAINIGKEYLAFFHSSFIGDNGLIWYSMGAYTFENQPPFRITAISPCPILFPGIYDSVAFNTAESRKRVIFPTSFVIEERNGKEWIHLSCGENDSSLKIITLDKEVLIAGLKKI